MRGSSFSRTREGSRPRTRTRFSRPRLPAATSRLERATPRAAARTLSTSRFAAPPTGRAPTRSARAPPWSPSRPGLDAPGRTCSRSTLPPAVGSTQLASAKAATVEGGSDDLHRQLLEAIHDDHLHEHDGEHHDERREIDAGGIDEGHRPTHPVEDRVGHRTEEPYDRIVRVRAHP